MPEEDTPLVPVTCVECETTTRVPLPEVAETVDRHNEALHDGAAVAEVDPDLADHIADLVAAELGLVGDGE